jgi:rhodanese-related sulfurtransferase
MPARPDHEIKDGNMLTRTPSSLAVNHGVEEVSPDEVQEWLTGGKPIALLDVREPREWDYCRIDGASLTPMSRFKQLAPGLDPEATTVVYCHTGVRSVFVCAYLQKQGFRRALSMAGGIDAWSLTVDPSVPRYR